METTRELFIDIETYSTVDLISCGVYRYVDDPEFKILLLAYAFGDDPVKVIDLAHGEQLPPKVISAIRNGDYIKLAHNANFERVCFTKHFGKTLNPDSWRCTSVRAATLGLPHSLEEVAKALGSAEQKMSEGKALIRLFCKPQSDGSRVMPWENPVRWEIFKSYNAQDVEVERAIYRRLESKPATIEIEQELYSVDQKMADEGVLVEMAMVENILEYYEHYTTALIEEAQRLTGIDNPKSALQAKKWLATQGVKVGSLDKEAVIELLKDKNIDPKVKKFLKIKQELGKTSIMKYDAMQRAICSDGRVHGMLQFYGAERTGRWAGRIVQLQNLPKNKISDLDLARSIVLDNDFDLLEMLYKSPMNICSQLIRTAFIAKDGHTFAVADYSAIEARVIAWLAQEQWRLDVFEGEGKIYEASASAMFHVPIEKIDKGSLLRAKGKVAELACIAEGSLVLTNKGYAPIEKITKSHLVWDGENFVKHDGLIYKGVKEVITYEGLTATEDHLVWIEGEDKPIYFGNAANSRAHLLQSRPSWKDLWASKNNKRRKKIHKRMESCYGIRRMPKLQKSKLVLPYKLNKWKIERLSNMQSTKTGSKMVGPKIYSCKAKMYQPKRQKLQKLWRSRNRVQVQISFGSLPLHDQYLWIRKQDNGIRSNRCKWSLRTGQLEMGNASTKLCESKKVYDILNCGPNNRYTANGYLVHNCGYAGGVGALKAMGADDMGLNDDELQDIVNAWRKASPNIVKFWKDVEDAAKEALMQPGKTIILRNLSFRKLEDTLFIKLPSGRELAYFQAQIRRNPDRNGTEIVYYGKEANMKSYQTVRTYSGKLVENIVQATARDCLAWSLHRLDKAGLRPVFHVHDEVVIEVPEAYKDDYVEEIKEIMTLKDVPWRKGLKLNAEAYTTPYYMKD